MLQQRMTNSCCFVILSCLYAVAVSNKTSSTCITPNGEQGTCIPISTCEALKTASPTIVREFACGDPGSFTVCCRTEQRKEENSPELKREYVLRNLLPNITLQQCGLQHSDDSDLNEDLNSIYEFPWLVYIPAMDYLPELHLGRKRKNCVGVLINERYFLTDVECKGTSAVLGLHSMDEDVTCITTPHVTADKYCTRPLIVETIDKTLPIPDSRIVLVRLRSNITYSDNIRPICLPIDMSNVQPQEHETVLSSGWGADEYTDGTVKIKKRISHSLMNNEDCEYSNAISSPICGITPLDNNDFVCPGDSGGPLMYHYAINERQRIWTVLGIITGRVDCDVHQPVVAERITPQTLNWLLDHIES